jgi:hypothetical protein
MSVTPIEHASAQRIGSVEFVAPNEIKIALDLEAPDGIAANAGIVPRAFPRINGYVLIASEAGYIVAQVEWIAVERSPFPKRKGFHDFGLVDLPFPLRKMRANPLGVLQRQGKQNSTEDRFEFKRGVHAFPSVGEPVLIPSDHQLRAIVESGENRYVKIGNSPLAANAEVKVDPDRLFGRHLAILGNTGSGKSCSVAGLIQWCLDEAKNNTEKEESPNARFIILDPNGEYSRVFNDKSKHKARVFQVGEKGSLLQVPVWFWNSSEWCSITQASAKVQRPTLRRALREIKAGRDCTKEQTTEEKKLVLRRYLSSRLISIRADIRAGTFQTDATKFGYFFKAISNDLKTKKEEFTDCGLNAIHTLICTALDARFASFQKGGETIEYYRPFEESEINVVVDEINKSLESLGGIVYQEGPGEDVPIPFIGSDLPDHLEMLAAQENVSQFLDFLVSRIRTMLSDIRMKEIIGDQADISLVDWLSKYIGSDEDDITITVIDLSLVPAEIIHIVTAVISRMVFEALQRYRKIDKDKKTLPTVLVAEEAHTFIKRYKEDAENQNAAGICTQVFEKIAREGRKYGLGLMLSSQRPSELSPTVLSQCNSFLLHRISNDKDQELVNRLVPDNLRGLLRELPSLPSQHAILLGWAAELPIMVRMNDLGKKEQPYSNDPEFWDVWTKKEGRSVDWKAISDDWQVKTE